MATVFQRGSGWTGKLRLWKADSASWVWVQRALPAGLDRAGALRAACELERLSAVAASGVSFGAMEDLVRSVLALAGAQVAVAPGTLAFAREFVAGKSLTEKSALKYGAALKRFESWLGKGKDRPLDAWKIGDWVKFYADLTSSLAPRTANEHIRFWRSVFNRAEKLGLVRSNLPAALELKSADSEGKEPITRADLVKVLRFLRRRAGERDRAWCALSLLGWHTGHRIADLLAVDSASFELRPDVGWLLRLRPGKKRAAGGRILLLPVPAYLVSMCGEGFVSLNRGGNYNGKVSSDFVAILIAAAVPVQMRACAARGVNSKSFHSFRHAMASRLASASVAPDVARLVTDHDSPVIHRGYVHTEILAIAAALRAARRK